MNQHSTNARRALRERAHGTRAARRATKDVRDGGLHTAKTWLMALGHTYDDADRYSGGFSRGIDADGTLTRTKRGRRKDGTRYRREETVKLYTPAKAAARAAVYRPQDKAAAARFERVAYTLAA